MARFLLPGEDFAVSAESGASKRPRPELSQSAVSRGPGDRERIAELTQKLMQMSQLVQQLQCELIRLDHKCTQRHEASPRKSD